MYQKRHLPAVAAAACLLFTAAACDGDPQGQGSTTPTATPSSTPTATPTKAKPVPPSMPPVAQNGLTVTSAEAFSRFFVAVLDYSAATGDARLIRQLQDNACSNCSSIADLHEKTYRAGGSITSPGGTRIVQTTQARLLRNDGAIVVFKTTGGQGVMRATATSTPIILPGGPGTIDLTLKARSGRWSVLWLDVAE